MKVVAMAMVMELTWPQRKAMAAVTEEVTEEVTERRMAMAMDHKRRKISNPSSTSAALHTTGANLLIQ